MPRLATITRSATARVFALAAALTLLSAWPLVSHPSSAIASDLGDPILNAWILWRNAHVLPLTDAWWNAPMFVPFAGAFALSESLLALLPLAGPLQWLGVSPIATYNFMVLLSGPAAAAGAFVLARRLTGRTDAALIAALAFGFSPYRIAQLPHMQVLWACWMPLALAALHHYLDSRRSRALVWFGVCWLMNGLTNGYYLVYFPLLVGLWVFWFVRRGRDVLAIGGAAAVATLPILPLLVGYATRQRAMGLARQIGEIRDFSADATAIFAAAPRAWLASLWTLTPRPEGDLYPGLAVLALAMIGLVVGLRQHRRSTRVARLERSGEAPARRRLPVRGIVMVLAAGAAALAVVVMLSGGSEFRLGPLTISVHRPSRLLTIAFWLGMGTFVTSPVIRQAWRSRSPLAFYLLGAAVMYFFALGPEPHAFGTQILYKPPYAWLMYVPGFDSVRVPARFAMLTIVCLAQAGAIAYARAFARHSRLPMMLLAGAILIEGWIPLPAASLPPPLPPPTSAVAAGALILELPIDLEFEGNTLALLHAMDHGRPTINGFSGYMPQHYRALGLALKDGDRTALQAIRSVGTIAAFVDASRDKNHTVGSIVASAPGASLLESNDRGAWHLLPMIAAPAEPETRGERLPPAAIDATRNPGESRHMADGRSETRWHGSADGETDMDVVTLTFETPVTIDLVEIDQGQFADGFARDLEIVLVTDAGDVSVFRGPTGGLAVRGGLASRDVTIKIELPASPPARAVRFISHPRGAKFEWSVGEIRTYGKRASG